MKLLLVLVVLILVLQESEERGSLEIGLVKWKNTDHLRADGSCCDGVKDGGKCKDPCDNVFSLYLVLLDENGNEIKTLPVLVTDRYENNDDIQFGSFIETNPGPIQNPFTYKFDSYKGNFRFKAVVSDYDKDGNKVNSQEVGGFEAVVEEKAVSSRGKGKDYVIKKITNSTIPSGSSLEIKLRVNCTGNALVPSCEEDCVDTNNAEGHYTCDYERGKKDCLSGYWNKDGNCKEACATGPGIKGACNGTTGEVTCREGWKGANCDEKIVPSSTYTSPSPTYTSSTTSIPVVATSTIKLAATSTAKAVEMMKTSTPGLVVTTGGVVQTSKVKPTTANIAATATFKLQPTVSPSTAGYLEQQTTKTKQAKGDVTATKIVTNVATIQPMSNETATLRTMDTASDIKATASTSQTNSQVVTTGSPKNTEKPPTSSSNTVIIVVPLLILFLIIIAILIYLWLRKRGKFQNGRVTPFAKDDEDNVSQTSQNSRASKYVREPTMPVIDETKNVMDETKNV